MVSVIRCRTTYLVLRRSCFHWARSGDRLHPDWPVQLGSVRPSLPVVTAVVKCSSSSSSCSPVEEEEFSMIYSQPHMRLLRAVSRLKLLQTSVTVLLLPPVFLLHLQGSASLFLLGYSTAVALFAGAMLYTASHFLRRVVGAMYLDRSQSTLKVSHLDFWGRRCDLHLAVEDVMTVGDTGDSQEEAILRLRRYSSSETLYFSTRLGRVVDRPGFQKVFGTLS